MEQKASDTLSVESLMKYHLALSVADRLEKEGFITPKDKTAIYTIIGRKYGVDCNSIFAA